MRFKPFRLGGSRYTVACQDYCESCGVSLMGVNHFAYCDKCVTAFKCNVCCDGETLQLNYCCSDCKLALKSEKGTLVYY